MYVICVLFLQYTVYKCWYLHNKLLLNKHFWVRVCEIGNFERRCCCLRTHVVVLLVVFVIFFFFYNYRGTTSTCVNVPSSALMLAMEPPML